MKKLEFSSLIDCFSHRGGMILSGFPPFNAFLIIVFMGIRCIYIKIKCNKRKYNAVTFKGKQRDNVNRAKPPHTFSCCCRNFKSKGVVGMYFDTEEDTLLQKPSNPFGFLRL